MKKIIKVLIWSVYSSFVGAFTSQPDQIIEAWRQGKS